MRAPSRGKVHRLAVDRRTAGEQSLVMTLNRLRWMMSRRPRQVGCRCRGHRIGSNRLRDRVAECRHGRWKTGGRVGRKPYITSTGGIHRPNIGDVRAGNDRNPRARATEVDPARALTIPLARAGDSYWVLYRILSLKHCSTPPPISSVSIAISFHLPFILVPSSSARPCPGLFT